MKSLLRIAYSFFTPLLITGCSTVDIGAGLSKMQDAVSHFDQATHSAADAEAALLKAEQAIDVDNQFYGDAVRYATTPGANFDLTASYEPRQVTVQQAETRAKLMSAVTLYADKMQALATGGDDTALDANSTALANSLGKMAAARNFTLTAGNQTLVADVEAGINAIARLALDTTRAKDLRSAAQEIDPELAKVIGALKNENTLLGQNIGNNLGGIELDLIVVARLAREAPNPGGSGDPQLSGSQKAQAFFAVAAGRQLLHADLVIAPATGAGGSKGPIDYHTVEYARAANEALDSVLNGNKAIAAGGAAGIYAAATDLAQRAKAAQAFAKALCNTP
jgi:hypothetical protein